MIKLKISGTPEEIQAYLDTLDQHDEYAVQYASSITKRAEHHKWGSAIAGVEVEVPVETVADVTIYQKSTAGKGKAQPGYVYLMPYYGPDCASAYKIGKTTNPDSRRRTFTIKLPFSVEFVALIKTDDCGKLEKELHRRFADKSRGSGEWFELTEEDVAYIKSLVF